MSTPIIRPVLDPLARRTEISGLEQRRAMLARALASAAPAGGALASDPGRAAPGDQVTLSAAGLAAAGAGPDAPASPHTTPSPAALDATLRAVEAELKGSRDDLAEWQAARRRVDDPAIPTPGTASPGTPPSGAPSPAQSESPGDPAATTVGPIGDVPTSGVRSTATPQGDAAGREPGPASHQPSDGPVQTASPGRSERSRHVNAAGG